MSNFPHKQFEGTLYKFEHLAPIELQVPLNASGTNFVKMHVTFGCHCFTEKFDDQKHQLHHRYSYKGELRAFDVMRFQCSLQLSQLVVPAMLKGRVYNADESYTYAAQITLPPTAGKQSYSVFFSLEKDDSAQGPALRMFVKSAYLKPLVAKPNAEGWRFASLAGIVAGVFEPAAKKPKPKAKKPKPEKKKAP